jgi:hypothetical protein
MIMTAAKSTTARKTTATPKAPSKSASKSAPAKKAPAKSSASKSLPVFDALTAPIAKKAPAKSSASKSSAAKSSASKSTKPVAEKLVPKNLPTGYTMRWAHKSFDLYRKTDADAKGAKWLVVCNVHGKFTTAENTGEGDALGTLTSRQSWCSGCKSAASKSA